MELILTVTIVVLLIAGCPLAFAMGVLHERIMWNNLIKQGILPTPDIAKGRYLPSMEKTKG